MNFLIILGPLRLFNRGHVDKGRTSELVPSQSYLSLEQAASYDIVLSGALIDHALYDSEHHIAVGLDVENVVVLEHELIPVGPVPKHALNHRQLVDLIH